MRWNQLLIQGVSKGALIVLHPVCGSPQEQQHSLSPRMSVESGFSLLSRTATATNRGQLDVK